MADMHWSQVRIHSRLPDVPDAHTVQAWVAEWRAHVYTLFPDGQHSRVERLILENWSGMKRDTDTAPDRCHAASQRVAVSAVFSLFLSQLSYRWRNKASGAKIASDSIARVLLWAGVDGERAISVAPSAPAALLARPKAEWTERRRGRTSYYSLPIMGPDVAAAFAVNAELVPLLNRQKWTSKRLVWSML